MQKTEILFENNEILVINKMYGLSVQGGVGITHSLDQDLSKELGYKIYLVHRLDKETSGLLIVAKNPKAAAKWTNLISSKDVKKEYLAICANLPTINGKKIKEGTLESNVISHGKTQNAKTFFNLEKEFFIELPNFADSLKNDTFSQQSANYSQETASSFAEVPVASQNRQFLQQSVSFQSKTLISRNQATFLQENRQSLNEPSISSANCESHQQNQKNLQENIRKTKKLPLYLIRLTLETGRMHQIRVQMANAKSPLLADDKYGDFKLNKILRKIGIKKLQLASVKLTLPINKKSVVLECKLPEHMQNVLNKGSKNLNTKLDTKI